MPRYYVNRQAQSTGEHEVHKADCSWLPSEENRKYLGVFDSCRAAVREAGKHYSKVDGCRWCSKECHKR